MINKLLKKEPPASTTDATGTVVEVRGKGGVRVGRRRLLGVVGGGHGGTEGAGAAGGLPPWRPNHTHTRMTNVHLSLAPQGDIELAEKNGNTGAPEHESCHVRHALPTPPLHRPTHSAAAAAEDCVLARRAAIL